MTALAHSRADGHGSRGVALALVVGTKFIHSGVDHADLRRVAVDNSDLPAILDEICN